MKSVALLSFLALLGFLAIGAATVHLWWAPFLPVIVGLSTITIPFIVAVFYSEKLFQRPNPQLLSTAAFVALLFGGALPGLWTDSMFRAGVVPLLGARDFSHLQNDPASEVHIAACRYMFETGRSEPEIVHFIQARPADALVCIDQLDAGTVPLALTRLWQFELRDGGSCDIASTIAQMAMVSAENRSIELLDCALSARTTEARRCCATAVKSLEQDANLPFWIMRHHADLQSRQTLRPLVLLSQGEEKTTVRYDAQTVSEAGLTNAVIQGAALHAACQAHAKGLGDDLLEEALKWSIAAQSNCVDAELTSSPLVADVCQIYLTVEPTLEAFCAANSQARLERAQRMEEARRPREPSTQLGEVADAILAADRTPTLDDYMESKIEQPGARPIHTYSEGEKAELRDHMNGTHPSARFREMMQNNQENLKMFQGGPTTR